MITLHEDLRPDLDAIRALYAASPLRRPIHDPARMAKMFEASNVVLTAYEDGHLVGILRGWTDGVYDGYICDLAIHPGRQKAGVGRQLLRKALDQDPGIQWVLLASPIAEHYYGHVGWEKLENGWRVPRQGWTPGSYAAFQDEHADLAARATLSPST